MNTNNHPFVHDVQEDLVFDGEDRAYKTSQYIPGFFLDDLAESRLISKKERCGEYHKVASIPNSVVSAMIHAGFDFYNAPPKDIVKWLRLNGYDRLFATSKNITFEERMI